MKCPNCGKEIAKDSIYCEYCGNKIIINGCERVEQRQLNTQTHVNRKHIILVASVALLHLTSLSVAYSVHWETFAYYGIGYEGYPGAGEYNAIFFACIIIWLVTLALLPICIYLSVKNYKINKHYEVSKMRQRDCQR